MPETRPPTAAGKPPIILIGWVCLMAGVVLMFASLWLFIIYAGLDLAALVIAIMALRQKRIVAGIGLLLGLLVAVPVPWFFLTVYRSVDAADHGITWVQNRTREAIAKSRAEDDASRAEEAAAAIRHRTDPAMGAWALTLWDEHGTVAQDFSAVGGFEQRDAQALRFSIPVDARGYRYRVYTITGSGSRGEWHDEPASDSAGWFEVDSRAADTATANAVPFTWNETANEGVPRRGIFTRSQ